MTGNKELFAKACEAERKYIAHSRGTLLSAQKSFIISGDREAYLREMAQSSKLFCEWDLALTEYTRSIFNDNN